MSHAILHSLISQHCAHWTHCCTHTHYRSEQETTYTVLETTTRQKSLVKDHLHSFLVASPSRETLIYQEICAVVFSRHSASLHLGGDGRGEGFTLLLLFLFSSLTSLLSHIEREKLHSAISSHLSWHLFWRRKKVEGEMVAHMLWLQVQSPCSTEVQLCLRERRAAVCWEPRQYQLSAVPPQWGEA